MSETRKQSECDDAGGDDDDDNNVEHLDRPMCFIFVVDGVERKRRYSCVQPHRIHSHIQPITVDGRATGDDNGNCGALFMSINIYQTYANGFFLSRRNNLGDVRWKTSRRILYAYSITYVNKTRPKTFRRRRQTTIH